MPLPKTQPRLPKILARDQVYQQLRSWLVEGVLQPGEKLNYHDIGRQLGFSAIPIREACLRLHYEGFVEMAHSRWTRVVSLDALQVIEINQAVEALEVYALELALSRVRSSDIRKLSLLNQNLREALESGETIEAVNVDRAFHAVWIDQSANQKVSELLVDLKDRLQIAESKLFTAEIVPITEPDKHESIIVALSNRNFTDVIRLLRDHWHMRLNRLQTVVETDLDKT